MLLTKVSTSNCALLGTTSIPFGRVTAIAGGTATGKSLLLGLIDGCREWVAPLGNSRPNLGRFVAPGEGGAKVVLELAFDAQEQKRFGVAPTGDAEILIPRSGEPEVDTEPELRNALQSFVTDGSQGLFDAIPAERDVRAGLGGFDLAQYRITSAGGAPSIRYGWIEGFLCDAALGVGDGAAAPSREGIDGRFERVGAKLRLAGARRVGGTAFRPVFASRGGEQVGLASLSSGERQLTLFVALLEALRPSRSILLVDDLDRDLDPSLQRGVLSMLAEGENQVVFTARSAEPRAPDVTSVLRLE
jgi:hypothetical protein